MMPLGRTKDLPFSEETLEAVREAHKALDALDKQAVKSWDYYMLAGAGLVAIRQQAMREAFTNRPFGREYTAAYAKLLAASKLDERIKDKGDRQKLVAVMDNRDAVEEWLATLHPSDRRRWTHPTTIWKKWQASLLPPRKYEDAKPAERKEAIDGALADQLIAKNRELSRLQMDTRCEVDLLHSANHELETWLRAKILPREKGEWLRDLLVELYPQRQPMPMVPVTHPDGAADDDIGLPPIQFPEQPAD